MQRGNNEQTGELSAVDHTAQYPANTELVPSWLVEWADEQRDGIQAKTQELISNPPDVLTTSADTIGHMKEMAKLVGKEELLQDLARVAAEHLYKSQS